MSTNSSSAVAWTFMSLTAVITSSMLVGYVRKYIIGVREGRSEQHLSFVKQLICVAVILLIADIMNLCENYYFYRRLETGSREDDRMNTVFSLLKTVPLAIGSLLHTIVGVQRLALFGHLFPYKWMKYLPAALKYTTWVLITANIVIAIYGRIDSLTGNQSEKSITTPMSWVYFMWILISHIILDSTIIYLVFKTKTTVMQGDKALVKEIKFILTILCINFCILLCGPVLAALNSSKFGSAFLRGSGEMVYRIYIAGNFYCYQQLKKFSTVKVNSTAASPSVIASRALGSSSGGTKA
ncbi:hypothetical protein BKA69DRAFT_1058215 [Paraphysoderma sedebokerense]|nr:hypothetical protein BKA69DRAFT_1058215 [Paraphysoderma sedebokerense]